MSGFCLLLANKSGESIKPAAVVPAIPRNFLLEMVQLFGIIRKNLFKPKIRIKPPNKSVISEMLSLSTVEATVVFKPNISLNLLESTFV